MKKDWYFISLVHSCNEKDTKLPSREITMYVSCVLITAMSSGRCPSTHVGNWKQCTRHLSSCRCPWYHRLPVTQPRLIDSRFFTRTHPLSGISLSVLYLATSRTDVSSSSSIPLFPLSSFRLHAYASRTRRSLTNLIYERRPAKDLPDESIRPKPIQRDCGLSIITTCKELYSLTLSALHLNNYKLMILRLSLDFYMASSHNILSYLFRLCNIFEKFIWEN